jgi:hypothetical protein
MAVSAALRLRWIAFVPVRQPAACWLWAGCKDRDGYGVIADAGRTLGAHRVSYEMHHRPLPPGSVVMHSCDTPACVNPAHLSLGTKRTNAADMTSKGRRASKLTREQALAIRARAAGESVGQLAATFGVSESTVRAIVSGRSWR